MVENQWEFKNQIEHFSFKRKIQHQEDTENFPLKAVTKELIGIIEKSGTAIYYCYIKLTNLKGEIR